MKKIKFQNLLALGAATALVTSVSAQTFTVDTLQADGSNISTASVQSTFLAWSIDSGSSTITVNGITFTEAASGGFSSDLGFGGFEGAVETLTGTDADPTPYTGNMATLMNEHRVSQGSGANGVLNVTFFNMTSGQDYRLQTLHDRGFDATDFSIEFFGSDSTRSTVVASSPTVSPAGAGTGELVTFEWTASGSSQFFQMPVSDGRTPLNGLVVQAVPEPSSYAAIGGLLALGAVLLRRRIRK